jgi:hypothetical protein
MFKSLTLRVEIINLAACKSLRLMLSPEPVKPLQVNRKIPTFGLQINYSSLRHLIFADCKVKIDNEWLRQNNCAKLHH